MNQLANTVKLLALPLPPALPAAASAGQDADTAVDVPGASSTVANHINEAGHIVATLKDEKGAHGFLATPVTDLATAALLGASRRLRRVLRRTVRAGTPRLCGTVLSRRNGIGAALLFGLLLGPAVPMAAALRGAYVEAILPSKPFKLTVIARQHLYDDVFVAGDGAYGITSITATNFDNFAKKLVISEPTASAGYGCGTPITTTVSNLDVAVPALSTVHLTFPSPMVFSAVNGHTCFRLYLFENSGMNVLLNGFSN